MERTIHSGSMPFRLARCIAKDALYDHRQEQHGPAAAEVQTEREVEEDGASRGTCSRGLLAQAGRVQHPPGSDAQSVSPGGGFTTSSGRLMSVRDVHQRIARLARSTRDPAGGHHSGIQGRRRNAMQLSARNQLKGTVKSVKTGAIMAEGRARRRR